jgi:hypothetical protein
VTRATAAGATQALLLKVPPPPPPTAAAAAKLMGDAATIVGEGLTVMVMVMLIVLTKNRNGSSSAVHCPNQLFKAAPEAAGIIALKSKLKTNPSTINPALQTPQPKP